MNTEKARHGSYNKSVLVSLVVQLEKLQCQEHIGNPRVDNLKEKLLVLGQKLLIDRMGQGDVNRLVSVESDPYEYSYVKYFHNTVVTEGKIGFDYYDQKTGIELRKGRDYLMIHVNELDKGLHRRNAFRRFEKAMGATSRYIKINRRKLPQGNLIGITHTRLAEASKRFGFTVAEASLPEHVRKFYASKLKLSSPEIAKKYPGISLCFQSYDDIIKRFSKSD